ncbi:MAG: hypothetical protein A2Y16_04395 [Tenericutes bacterium GWF2_57_13]|nr:MAG: hypothetical protein A2Y16_04395 [Tenericutes bacterium GWF2_57_13]
MKIWDYKRNDEGKIRRIYLGILSRRTKKKHTTISHSSLKTEIIDLIKSDLIRSLSLSDEQATWLINSHIGHYRGLKDGLLDLDTEITDRFIYRYYSFIHRVKKNANLGLLVFLIFLLASMAMLISMLTGWMKGDLTTGLSVSLTWTMFNLLGLSYVFFYYRHIYQLEKDIDQNDVQTITGEIKKINLKEHIKYFRDMGYVLTTYYGISLRVQVQNESVNILYPFLERDVRIKGGGYFRIRSKKQKTLSTLGSMEHITVRVFKTSRIVAESISRFEKIMYRDEYDV